MSLSPGCALFAHPALSKRINFLYVGIRVADEELRAVLRRSRCPRPIILRMTTRRVSLRTNGGASSSFLAPLAGRRRRCEQSDQRIVQPLRPIILSGDKVMRALFPEHNIFLCFEKRGRQGFCLKKDVMKTVPSSFSGETIRRVPQGELRFVSPSPPRCFGNLVGTSLSRFNFYGT